LTISYDGVAESLTISKERNNRKIWPEDGSLPDTITGAGFIHSFGHDSFDGRLDVLSL
jgi:hypothetical protein